MRSIYYGLRSSVRDNYPVVGEIDIMRFFFCGNNYPNIMRNMFTWRKNKYILFTGAYLLNNRVIYREVVCNQGYSFIPLKPSSIVFHICNNIILHFRVYYSFQSLSNSFPVINPCPGTNLPRPLFAISSPSSKTTSPRESVILGKTPSIPLYGVHLDLLCIFSFLIS